MTPSMAMAVRLKSVAKKIKQAAKWHGSGLAVDSKTDDYVYELLCYFQVALAAQKIFSIEVAGAIKKPGKSSEARWPKKPGMKKNFSYFNLLDCKTNTVQFQLCPGINIEDLHGKLRAPDINLLRAGASIDPTHIELLACWDAKHTSNPTSRLPDTAVSDFVYTFQQLGAPTPPMAWTGSMSNAAYLRSGLLTNGNMSTEPDSALNAHSVSETYFFPTKPVTRP